MSDVIYSDDDKVDMNGHRFAPQFKPDWSPVLLLSYMYIGHLTAIRRSLFQIVGGIRTGFDGSQDYDMTLRATELARHVGHIPRILYQWRVAPGSVAATTDEKPQSIFAGLKAVADAFARRGIDAVVHWSDWARVAKIGVYSATFPDDGPRVSILIPTRNKVDLLRTCVASLAKTTYRNYEVVILDNDSDDPATMQFLSRCGHRVLRISSPGGQFSFAHINNTAVRQVDSEYVLLAQQRYRGHRPALAQPDDGICPHAGRRRRRRQAAVPRWDGSAQWNRPWLFRRHGEVMLSRIHGRTITAICPT